MGIVLTDSNASTLSAFPGNFLNVLTTENVALLDNASEDNVSAVRFFWTYRQRQLRLRNLNKIWTSKISKANDLKFCRWTRPKSPMRIWWRIYQLRISLRAHLFRQTKSGLHFTMRSKMPMSSRTYPWSVWTLYPSPILLKCISLMITHDNKIHFSYLEKIKSSKNKKGKKNLQKTSNVTISLISPAIDSKKKHGFNVFHALILREHDFVCSTPLPKKNHQLVFFYERTFFWLSINQETIDGLFLVIVIFPHWSGFIAGLLIRILILC